MASWDSSGLIKEIMDLVASDLPFTDIHIEENQPIMIDGPDGWRDVDGFPPSKSDIEHLVSTIDSEWRANLKSGPIGRPYDLSTWRLRVTAYYTNHQEKIAASIRRQPKSPPEITRSGLPDTLRDLADAPSGLILVVGATGAGKTTSLASICDYINRQKNAHIITIEDPIEYIHERRQSIFSQREVGSDVKSFTAGLKEAMRQRPDVIMVGEIRDVETADITLLAAESGHLVLASMHANASDAAISKMLGFFPETEKRHRGLSLANSLLGVIYQRLLPSADRRNYTLATEALFNHNRQLFSYLSNPDMRPELRNFLLSRKDGVSYSFSDSLVSLCKQHRISSADALKAVTYDRVELVARLKENNVLDD